ncbi:MAG: hypothetical protein BGO76_07680 [Caedibacter sp. 38-128]|nr:hypothetical protein [Holosporales bacterium]OJX04882.1 MAG: hypothetical protein BGO76_07680 [Caedibacter sp. 38-128]
MRKIYLLIAPLFFIFLSEVHASEPLISANDEYFDDFKKLHQLGYQGNGQRVVILEPAITLQYTHPAFLGKEIQAVDVGRNPQPPTNFNNQSRLRYTHDFCNKVLDLFFWTPSFHAQGITSILIANPLKDHYFSGGLIPQAKLKLVSFSQVAGRTRDDWVDGARKFASTSIYPFGESGFIRTDAQKRAIESYSQEQGINFSATIIDDSIYDAFRNAFRSSNRLILGSFNLESPCDFKNLYFLTPDFLNFLVKGLEETDQILILSAGNFGFDISEANKKGIELRKQAQDMNPKQGDFIAECEKVSQMNQSSEFLQKVPFKQFAEHPILKKRVLIVVNAMISSAKEKAGLGRGKVKLSNSKKFDICLNPSSCYPGMDKALQDITITAFGTNIKVATDMDKDIFKLDSGTSFAVPMVGSLLSLIDEYHKRQNKKISGTKLVEILKKGCALPKPGKTDLKCYYGNGLMDPLAFLDKSDLKRLH